MSKILVIDDQESIRRTLKEILEYENFEVTTVNDGQQGLDIIEKQKFDVILCDIKMPKVDGIEFLETIQKADDTTPIIMISGHGDIDTAVESIKKGAYDYVGKPIDLNRLLVTLRNAVERKSLQLETKQLKRKVNKNKTGEIIGNSEPIKKIKELIERVAPTDARVLITGNNGTGKELVARWIHELSNRSAGPLIEVNCAAIPSELIESELFGHEKGAFTSALKLRQGKFESAEGGTIFLDEIGDMSLSAQAKVLRALQENKISRVGAEKEIKVDVRVVAATNKNLQEEIKKGNFREDLFHRLNVIPIHVPDLNDRRDDIPVLADYFLEQICADQGISTKSFTKDAYVALKDINWTGNIRELRNVIERLIILCDSKITGADVKTFAQPNKS